MEICLIGCGKMGTALLAGWQQDSQLNASFTVIDPALDGSSDHQATRYLHQPSDLETLYQPDLVVLAVKPQTMASVLADLSGLGDETTCFLSIAAGLSTARLAVQLGRSARWLRVMPNTPAAIGQGISALYAAPDVPLEMINLSRQLMGAVGEVVDLADETLMDAVTALSGSGPAYVFLLAEVMAAAGEKLGLPADLCVHLARQTVSGAGAPNQRQRPDSCAAMSHLKEEPPQLLLLCCRQMMGCSQSLTGLCGRPVTEAENWIVRQHAPISDEHHR